MELELRTNRQHVNQLRAESVATSVKNTTPKPVCKTTKQIELLEDQSFREHLRNNAFKGDEPCRLQQFVAITGKSASVYIFEILRKIANNKKLNMIDYGVLYSHKLKNPESKVDYNDFHRLNRNKATFYLAGRGLQDIPAMNFCQENNLPFKTVYVVRDPRDLIVSDYFSAKHSHAIMGKMQVTRDEYLSISIDDGITANIEKVENSGLVLMCGWQAFLDDPRVLFLNYEFMKTNSLLFFSTLLKFLEIDFSWYYLNSLLDKENFKTVSGRKVGVEDVKNHYRKGIVGDWKNYFKDHHIKQFFSKPNCSKAFYGFGYNNPNE